MCGVGEASKEENKSWEDAISCKALESSNHMNEMMMKKKICEKYKEY